MSAYRDALSIDSTATQGRVDLAIALLENCEGVVLWDETVALRPEPNRILCEVIDQFPSTPKSPEQYGAMVKAAREMLEATVLEGVLSCRPQEWIVVEDYETGTLQCWPAT